MPIRLIYFIGIGLFDSDKRYFENYEVYLISDLIRFAYQLITLLISLLLKVPKQDVSFTDTNSLFSDKQTKKRKT